MHAQGTLCALSRGIVELDQIERGTIGMHGDRRTASRRRFPDAWLPASVVSGGATAASTSRQMEEMGSSARRRTSEAA